MDPQWIIAGAAVITVLMTWTSTTWGAAVWLMKRLDSIKKEILEDNAKKHEENRIRVDAMQQLLFRHDALIDPEYNGKGRSVGRHER